MSAAWFIALSLVWTGGLAGLAQLLTGQGAGARYAQLVWRGAACLSLAPWIVLAALSILPRRFPSELPEIPYFYPLSETVETASMGLRSALAGPDWSLAETGLLVFLVAGWCVRAGLSLAGQMRLQRLKAASAELSTDARVSSDDMPPLRAIPSGSPFIAGLLRPAVYIPDALKSPEDQRHVVIHECVHMERGDLITRPFERLIADIFWFSPFAWTIRRELDFWREAVCDEIAAERSGDPIGYARTLARAARSSAPLRTLPVSSFILPRKRSLPMRLTRILDSHQKRQRPLLASAAALMALAVAPFAVGQGSTLTASISYSHPVLIEASAKVTSEYGMRTHPISGKELMHKGIDIKGPMGTPIYSPAEGEVGFSGYKDGYGEMVEVIYADGSKLIYCQLSERLLETGDTVAAGEKVGLLGASGRATGPHLHVEYWRPVAGADGAVEMKSFDPASIDGLVLYQN